MEDSKNDWDTDSGYLGKTSSMSFSGTGISMDFISEPIDVNSNSPKHLGISKGATFWKCFIGEHDIIESATPWEEDISLSKFTTDIPR